MELFHVIMDILGSLSMLFVAGSMCLWGPMLLKAIHRMERRQDEQWERHYEFEVKKARAIMNAAGMKLHPVEPRDVN